jgi:hypothetical protein
MAKAAIPRGARIPVKTKTAAMGKKTTPKGICRHSRPTINSLSIQGIVALDEEGVCVATMKFVSVTTQYVAVSDHN